MEIDVANQTQEYWEKILAAENLPGDLSLREQVNTEALEITAEEFKELANLEPLPEEDYERDDPVINFNGITKSADTLRIDHSGLIETNEELRTKAGGNDPFFMGHSIIKPQPGGTAKKTGVTRRCPDWAQNKGRIRNLLLQSFPKLMTNDMQRVRAGRWARVIQLYYRKQMTHGQIASELRLPLSTILSVIRSIDRSVKGGRANGSGKRSGRFGRPRKSCHNPGIL